MLNILEQITAYEMRISDWSSDLFSSDLQWAEVIALGNEIGLAVEFDDRDRLVIAGNCEHAFGRGAAGFLVGLGRAVHAQLFNCLVEVATGGVELLTMPTFWKVRPKPMAALTCGGDFVTSRPREVTGPVFGW